MSDTSAMTIVVDNVCVECRLSADPKWDWCAWCGCLMHYSWRCWLPHTDSGPVASSTPCVYPRQYPEAREP